MATTSRRVTRLQSREPSVRISERRLKPKTAVTTNKNSKKVNVSVKGKSLRVSKENVSLKNSGTIRLRSRLNRKNYCENSRLLQQFISSEQHDSVVILERLNVKDKKVPVYKAVRPSEKSPEDKNDVYDFKFDLNDTKEKASKKKGKRNVNKGKSKTIKKITRKKVTAQPKAIGHKVIKYAEPNANLSTEIAQSNPLGFVKATESSTKKYIAKKIETSKINTDIQLLKKPTNKDIGKEIEPPRVDTDIQIVEESIENAMEIMETSRPDTNVQEEITLPGKAFTEQTRKEHASKPRIISIENANNITVTKCSPNKTDDSLPFRQKNIFHNKTSLKEHNSMLKCSSLTLSPIQKTANTLDFASPWRAPTLMFSQTKHFIQSTPYKNLETHKENKETNKKSMEIKKENVEMNKENVEMNKENIEMDKENIDMNKENKGPREKERKKKKIGLRKKNAIQKKLPISENQTQEKVRAAIASKSIIQPARISLGEIKNLLQRPNNRDNIQADQTHTEVNKSGVEQKNKQLVDFINFSDTFDVLSETEKLSTIENDAPLFMDLEPSHFSKVFITNIYIQYIFVISSFINYIYLKYFSHLNIHTGENVP